MVQLPANPLSIELTMTSQDLWWQTKDDTDGLEYWQVSADVWELDPCPPERRHVGLFRLAVAELNSEQNMLDALAVGEWLFEYIAETVLNLSDGRLLPELDAQVSAGVERMVILCGFELEEAWRGHGLAAPLIGATLARFSETARLAVCRVSPADFNDECPDRISAELTCLRLGALLERIGFFLWKGVYVVDLKDRALADAGIALFRQWGPCGEDR
jgi:GNAT superfamily N-acetyltransferase